MKRFFCRACRAGQMSAHVPTGWYLLSRGRGGPGRESHRLGLYCSARCLAAAMPEIALAETAMGEEWADMVKPLKEVAP